MVYRLSILCSTLCAGLLVVALAGCESKSTYAFDELDSTPAQDELIEFSLGNYKIPIPLTHNFGPTAAPKRNRLEFSFELYALIARDYQSQLASLWHRHEGKIRDHVIQACRNAKLEELEEPELSKLKSHLNDAIQAELGANSIRRLLVSEVVLSKL